ncbi:hypothetical protein LXL04_037874 [Taraxacum kok-saghyz]
MNHDIVSVNAIFLLRLPTRTTDDSIHIHQITQQLLIQRLFNRFPVSSNYQILYIVYYLILHNKMAAT